MEVVEEQASFEFYTQCLKISQKVSFYIIAATDINIFEFSRQKSTLDLILAILALKLTLLYFR